MPTELQITDDNYTDFLDDDRLFVGEDGKNRKTGLAPRVLEDHPKGCFANAPTEFPFELFDPDTYEERLAERKARNAQLSQIRMKGMGGEMIPSRDQNGQGYCWAYSSTSAIMMLRAIENQPYADLSGHAVGCMVKGFRDQGGFGAESINFISNKGIPTSKYWPLKSMKKSNDNPETWKNAELHKFTKWIDVQTREQFITLLLMGLGCVSDFNWWSHSVYTMELESVNKHMDITSRIWNSWSDKWSLNGTGLLKGSKAFPDDIVCPYTDTAAAA